MLRMALGGVMMLAGLVLAFIPPFIFGIMLFAAGLYVGFRGMFGVTKDAAKATAAGVKAVQNHNREADLARRERELAEREASLARERSTPSSS